MVKSSSIVGGAQVITLILSMIRTKVVALLIGPAGVGVVGLYQSATVLVGTVAGLGISQSGVRQVAESHGTGEMQRLSRTVAVLRRICWLTGFGGWVLMAALAWPISVFSFGDSQHAWPLAVLGATVLFASVSAGQSALIQGIRRVGDLAKFQVVSAAVGTLVSAGLYAWLGKEGILWVFLAIALINLGFSWRIARSIEIPRLELRWKEVFEDARHFITLGIAFMWSNLLGGGVALVIQSQIARHLGIESNGVYQAAWALSGVFGNFILNAMVADFYPRLTAVATDDLEVNRLVNQQTEVGILLALPGVMGTLALSSLAIRVFYSAKFNPACELLPWFVLGVFGRIITLPMHLILLARSLSRTFALTETIVNTLYLLLAWGGLAYFGLVGTAVAFAAVYAGVNVGIFVFLASRYTGFRWSVAVLRLLAYVLVFALSSMVAMKSLPSLGATIVGTVLAAAASLFSLGQLIHRLGPEHRISRMMHFLPFMVDRM